MRDKRCGLMKVREADETEAAAKQQEPAQQTAASKATPGPTTAEKAATLAAARTPFLLSADWRERPGPPSVSETPAEAPAEGKLPMPTPIRGDTRQYMQIREKV